MHNTYKSIIYMLNVVRSFFLNLINLDKYKNKDKEIWICKEDLEHHVRFFSTGSFSDGRKTPTPVEVFTFTAGFGVVSNGYLDKFPPESSYYEDIQKFKSNISAKL